MRNSRANAGFKCRLPECTGNLQLVPSHIRALHPAAHSQVLFIMVREIIKLETMKGNKKRGAE